jgi:hypothetical protein
VVLAQGQEYGIFEESLSLGIEDRRCRVNAMSYESNEPNERKNKITN